MSLIMETYESWKQCLCRNMGSELTKSFVQSRIANLSNRGDPDTKKFTQCYGDERRVQVLSWFRQLEGEL